MRKLGSLACCLLLSVAVWGQDNMASREKFQDNKFGIFLHWGLYSMTAQGEWYLNSGIRHDEYKKLAAFIRQDSMRPNGYRPSRLREPGISASRHVTTTGSRCGTRLFRIIISSRPRLSSVMSSRNWPRSVISRVSPCIFITRIWTGAGKTTILWDVRGGTRGGPAMDNGPRTMIS